MPRLDEVGAQRIPEQARAKMFSPEQLDGFHVWVILAHRQESDMETYRLAGGGMLVHDDTDGGELHLDADAVAQFMDTAPKAPRWVRGAF